jgi:hypothetical protein
LSDKKRSVVTVDNSGRQHLEYEDVVLDEDSNLIHSIEAEPATAKAEVRRQLSMHYFASDPAARQEVDISTVSTMSADRQNFYLVEQLEVGLNGESFFDRKYQKTIERKLV